MSLLPVYSPAFMVSLFASNTIDNSETITCPANVEAGDLIVLLDRADDGLLVSKVIPSGFTEIVDTDSGVTLRMVASYKKAIGNEGGSTLTGMNSSGQEGKMLYVFRPNFKANYAVADVGGQEASGAPTNQTITSGSSATKRPVIAFGCFGVYNGSINNAILTPSADGSITALSAGQLSYRIMGLSPPTDVVASMNDSGEINIMQSFYIETS